MFITGCAEKDSDESGLMVTEGPESFMQMINASETIVVASKTGVDTIISSENETITIHVQIEVLEVLKRDLQLAQQKINILTLEQLRAWKEEGQEKYILFLDPSAGKEGEYIYTVVGLTLGVLKIDQSNQVFWSRSQNQSGSDNLFYMDEEFRGLSFEDTINKIKKAVDDK